MTLSLENNFIQFNLDLQRSSWSLYPKKDNDLTIGNVQMQLAYKMEGTVLQSLKRWLDPQCSDRVIVQSPQGSLQSIQLATAVDAQGVAALIEFALCEEQPIFLWRASLQNQSHRPIYPQRLTLLSTAFAGENFSEPAFFSNGWGSWNHTGAFGASDSFRRSRLGPFYNPMRINAGTPQPASRGHFASDFFGVLGDRVQRRAMLAGFLSQKQHFGSLEARLDTPQPELNLWANGDGAHLDPGESITTDWACLYLLDIDAPQPLAPYLRAVAREHNVSQQELFEGGSPTGWCSWYHFFQQVTAGDIQRNLEILDEMRADLPLQVFQIDDGFETHVGDWFDFKPTFPDGVASLAQEIQGRGFMPGLWLAPFILERGSRLAQEHPDWLLRGRLNRPVNAGFIWDQFTTALDLTHPDALAYTEEVINTAAQKWGFPYLKLDFLYAAALPGRYRDPRRTRAQVLRTGLERLRTAAGENTFLLGCGCPMGSAIGLVEAMRIGADVGERWRPSYQGIEFFFQAEPDMPAARNAIQNALTRLPFHRTWWYNDPDCLLLRPTTDLTLDEVQSLAAVIALGDGALLLSDDMGAVPEERLQIATALLPPVGKAAHVLDWFDSATPSRLRLDLENESGRWHLLGIFNWQDKPQVLELRLTDFGLDVESGEVLARDFWQGEFIPISIGRLHFKAIPPHGCLLLAVRQVGESQPSYLGGDLHISQGQEVSAWHWDPAGATLDFTLERPGHAEGKIDLYLPKEPVSLAVGDQVSSWNCTGEGIYRIEVDFQERAVLQLKL